MANININIWWCANCQNVDINTAKYFQGKANRKSYQLKSERKRERKSERRQSTVSSFSVWLCDGCMGMCASLVYQAICVRVCPLCMWSLSIAQPQTHSHVHKHVGVIVLWHSQDTQTNQSHGHNNNKNKNNMKNKADESANINFKIYEHIIWVGLGTFPGQLRLLSK